MKGKLSIRNMKVKNKLTLFSGVALAIIVIITVAAVSVVLMVNKARSERYTIYGDRQLYLSDAFTYFNQVKIDTRNIIYMYDTAEEKEDREAAINSIGQQFDLADERMDLMEVYIDQYGKDIQNGIAEVRSCLDEYSASVDKIVDYLNSNNQDAAEEELRNGGMVTANKAQGVLDELMDNLISEADANSVKIENKVKGLITVLVVICLIAFLILGVFCVDLVKQIAEPIVMLSEASKKLAIGDIDVDCHKINDDDLGELTDEFHMMADAIKSQTRTTDIVASGDLTVDVTPRSEKDVLGKALQKLVADDNRTLGNIKESSMQVTIGAEQVASASQSLAQGSTEQASALQQVTASMAEIAERTKANASQATEADNLVHNVKNSASDGNEQMKSMIDAMKDINDASETISKIIKTIDDISFQTNILALNAAVEAARAGVHGKGFAVVAEEVRNLAAKSASAASETAEMIEDTIHKVSNGAKIAEETAKSLDEIVVAIDKIVELIGNIAVASNDQATAVSQIDQAIGQVSKVVQTNSATSEQCAAASEELSNQAANLRELLGHYRLLSGNNSSSVDSASYSSGEQVISLDGEFGKY